MKYDLSDYDLSLIVLSLRNLSSSAQVHETQKEESYQLSRHLVYCATHDPEAEPFD